MLQRMLRKEVKDGCEDGDARWRRRINMDERQKCIEQEQEQLGAARGCLSSMLEALEASVHQAAGSYMYSLELLARYTAPGPDPAPPAAPPPKGIAAAMGRLLRVPSRHPFSLVHSQDSQASLQKIKKLGLPGLRVASNISQT